MGHVARRVGTTNGYKTFAEYILLKFFKLFYRLKHGRERTDIQVTRSFKHFVQITHKQHDPIFSRTQIILLNSNKRN